MIAITTSNSMSVNPRLMILLPSNFVRVTANVRVVYSLLPMSPPTNYFFTKVTCAAQRANVYAISHAKKSAFGCKAVVR
jgi:hypothetical protein